MFQNASSQLLGWLLLRALALRMSCSVNEEQCERAAGSRFVFYTCELCERLYSWSLKHSESVEITLILRSHNYIFSYCRNSLMKNLLCTMYWVCLRWIMIAREQNLAFQLLENFMIFVSVVIKLVWHRWGASFVWLKCYDVCISRDGIEIFFFPLSIIFSFCCLPSPPIFLAPTHSLCFFLLCKATEGDCKEKTKWRL